MKLSPVIAVVILAVGVALLIWGFNAKQSFASGVSEAVQGAPSDKSIVLLVIGGLICALGLIGLLRRA
jgi:uncharacterized membrane protein